MNIILFSCIVLIFSCTGCASLVSEHEYTVSIMSDPPDATVIVRSRTGTELLQTKTPGTVKLASKSGYLIPARYSFEFRKNGYNPCFENLVGELNIWYLGNALLPGGIIGILLVDPLTGAMWKLDRNVFGNLTAETGGTVRRKDDGTSPGESDVETDPPCAEDPAPNIVPQRNP